MRNNTAASMAALMVELPAEKDITGHVTGVVTGVVRQEVIRITKICITPKSRKELMTELGLKHAGRFREAYLVPALEAGMIEQTIPDKPTSRIQKYRLTGKGGSVLPEKSQEQEHIHARSVSLGSDILGITAKIDMVDGNGEVVTPVDYKHGKYPPAARGFNAHIGANINFTANLRRNEQDISNANYREFDEYLTSIGIFSKF